MPAVNVWSKLRKPEKWNREVDVVVMGTGGAALTAAITAHDQGLKVLVVEKTHQIGGTTAFSGGVPWIPMNRYMKEKGIEDTREEALKYIRRITGGKEHGKQTTGRCTEAP